MDRTREQQAVRQAMCEVGCAISGPVCTGPGMVGVWIGSLSSWYVMEATGRRWWTNDQALITEGSPLVIADGEVEEDGE